MKKSIVLLLCLAMALSVVACAPKEEAAEAVTLTGAGEGFGGEITATVVKEGDKIVSVEVVGEEETDGIGTLALDQLPAMIVEANSTEVDAISGATYTSDGIIYAVNSALDPAAFPPFVAEVKEPTSPVDINAAEVTQGVGIGSYGRKGPGVDDKDVQVWTFNTIMANVLFDKEGKILDIFVDQLEVGTPNYDGAGMPHLSGFPGQGGYNYDENHDEMIDSMTPDTEEQLFAEVEGWETKRARGEAYVMGGGTIWFENMDAFQELFVGKTVAEIEEWNSMYTSDNNGRPLKDASEDAADKAKYDALSDDERAMLADVTSSATMSLTDAHGDIIAVIKKAYESRMPLEITEAASSGFGFNSSARKGPGVDDKDVQVWSINEIFANTMFDADGKIVSLHIDQLEFATPNYDGDGMPHFSGFPGQGGYNYDENHDEKIDGMTPDTEENYFAEIEGWKTKRERGDAYVMGGGTIWFENMDAFEELFVGMTIEEVEEWNSKYTSDNNGRPLKDASEDAADKAKYDALSDDDKAMLADVTSSATMSLTDEHGNIINAIKASYENRRDINLSIGN
ncbi:MAG: FMN-binding protein [Gudongella sp.]|nr:FMN-binding protein [Gudongella sp.]